ncbi:Sulfotransferase domain protein [Planctomycetes bacterium Poly30]|uniref:Sulfotransferase domain protein n=1 Tax=Saltatorellus ferox TaxID=2528018 RepID=A0A518EXH9_9BACT|nr:Sulfotransferase domain protein [Planctomycetes bacterium Poly30]
MSKRQKKSRSPQAGGAATKGLKKAGPSREESVNAALKASYERLQRRQYEKAEVILRKALSELGRDPRMLGNLVAALENQGRGEEALTVARSAVEHFPEDAQSHNNLGAITKFQGDLAQAEASFRRAVELAPDYADAWRHLAGLKTFTSADDPDLAHMRDLLQRMPRNNPQRAAIYFAIARALDEIGDTDEAFTHFERGNRARRGTLRFSAPDLSRLISETIELQSAELIGRGPAEGAPDDAPILIVGMPRSGSTLIEQVLASHPDVEGVGEVPDLPRALDPFIDDPKFRMRSLSLLSDDELATVGKAYALSLKKRAPEAGRIVDKFLTNYIHLGTLHRALPNARIIHATRDPLDNAFGCYTTLFTSEVPFVYDFKEIAATIAESGRLMDHWKSVMPHAIHEVKYESMVSDLEGETRRLLEFLGLPWSDRCLDFHNTDRRVNSASATQVRKPLYSSSVGRWKRYESHLAPMKRALAEYGVIDSAS